MGADNESKCFDCELPCKECGLSPTLCTECSQVDGIRYLLGPTCALNCPAGFITNEEARKCEGCGLGCEVCDKKDQRICVKCDANLLLHQGNCVSDCPDGFMADYDAIYCFAISELDVKLYYFPTLIISALAFLLSFVGSK